MSAFGEVSPAELPQFLEDFANQEELYRDGMLDGYSLSKELWPRNRQSESYVKFKVKREREAPELAACGVTYVLEEGATAYLQHFPNDVLEAIGDDCDLEEDDSLWVTDTSSYAVAYRDGEDGLLIPARAFNYGTNDTIVLEAPVISGQKIMSIAVAHTVISSVIDSREGLQLAEYTLPVEMEQATIADSFDSIISGLTAENSRLEECIERMVNMLAILRR